MTAETASEAGYSAEDVARITGLPVAQVRAYARRGLLDPRPGAAGTPRFSLGDIAVLRTARMLEGQMPRRRVARALSRLRGQLAPGETLSSVRLVAGAGALVARRGGDAWEPESGQALLDFGLVRETAEVAPLPRRGPAVSAEEPAQTAEDWFHLGYELESDDAAAARAAYARAIEIDPRHVGARVNLGRFLHEAGQPGEAEEQYRLALLVTPGEVTAAYNLGCVLEDLGRPQEALAAYERAVAIDPGCADAHYNAARLYEQQGDRTSAFRHLKAYRQLTDG